MARRLVLLGLLVLAAAPPAWSRDGVVGGTAVTISTAPWTVYVRQTGGTCSGSIVDALHVLTAAHCVYDDKGNLLPPTALAIRAGISNAAQPLGNDAEQDRGVTSLRVHPSYTGTGAAGQDDVALLALSAPLDLGGGAVQAIALPSLGMAYPAGASFTLAGFGRESPAASPDGSLNAIALTADEQGHCNGDANAFSYDAVVLCATAPSSSVCSGDSGAGLVTTQTPHVLVGVLDASFGNCGTGSAGIYTYLGAPEILRFVQGDDQPPAAPRLGSSTDVELDGERPLTVGTALTCTSSSWVGTVTSTEFAFVDTRSGTVLQQGSKASYVPRTQDVGATIACRAFASNHGGTAVAETTAAPPVAALHLGIAPLHGVVLVRGRADLVRVVLETPAGLRGRFDVCVRAPASVAARACAAATVTDGGSGGYPLDVTLHVKNSANPGTIRLAISAVAGGIAATTTATATVRR